MDRKLKCLAILAFPLFASCSSNIGLVRNEAELNSLPNAQVECTKRPALHQSDPEGAFHIVGEGESLKHICQVYGLDLNKVAKINRLMPPYNLKEGDSIFLPSTALVPDKKYLASTLHSSESAIIKATRNTVTNAIMGKRDPVVPELRFPVPGGVLTSPFGLRWGRLHKGLDIAAPNGKSVLACADGKVIFTGSRKKFRRYGNTVLLDHGKGVYTYYAHLNDINVKKGQSVKKGQRIASVGNTGRSTGPHLHLEVRVNNTMYNPLAYFSPSEVAGTLMAKRFNGPPMGPIRAKWEIPDLLMAGR